METVASLIERLKKYPPLTPIKFWASETEVLFVCDISMNYSKTKPILNISMEYE